MTGAHAIRTLVTSNILEVVYLLDRGHQIVEVTIDKSFPYEIAELSVMMAGQYINLDRGSFLTHGIGTSAASLKTAFSAILEAAYLQEEKAGSL
jgi:hypothetical protein